MKLTSLLSQLNELETALQSFSLEELSISEASRLKSSFEIFKNRVEENFWGTIPDDQNTKLQEQESGIRQLDTALSRELHNPLNGVVSSFSSKKLAQEPISAEAVRGLNILVFEDDQFNQWLLKKRLNSWGCIYHITDNANFGLKILEDQQIDLVLMDLYLPGTDGFEITARIRQSLSEHVHSVPVIAISADIGITHDLRCEESGIDDFILKPYTQEELLTKMISASKLRKSVVNNEPPDQNRVKLETKNKPRLDLQPILDDFLGEVELVEEFTGLYKKNILEFIGQVKLGLQQEDANAVEFATHKIKTGLRIIPTPVLLGIVETMHAMSMDAPDFETMSILHQAFMVHYPKVEKELDEALELLKK